MLLAVGIAEIICVIALVSYLIRRHFTEGGILWLSYREPTDLIKVKCTVCGGLGVMYLDNGREGKLPDHIRETRPGDWRLHGKVANTKRCLYCSGLGFTWRRR